MFSSPYIGDEKDEKGTLDGLMAARDFIRTEIRERMGVRHVPELTFAIDRSEKINARMDETPGPRRESTAKRYSAKRPQPHRRPTANP